MNNNKSKVIYYLFTNSNCNTGKFNFQEMADKLEISFNEVIDVIKELQAENIITLYCPKCSENSKTENK